MSSPLLSDEEAWNDFDTPTLTADQKARTATPENSVVTSSSTAARNTTLKPDEIYAINYTIYYWRPSADRQRNNKGHLVFFVNSIRDLVSVPKSADFHAIKDIFQRRIAQALPQVKEVQEAGGKVTFGLKFSETGYDDANVSVHEDNWSAVVKLWLEKLEKSRSDNMPRGRLQVTVTMKPVGCDGPAEFESKDLGCVMQ